MPPTRRLDSDTLYCKSESVADDAKDVPGVPRWVKVLAVVVLVVAVALVVVLLTGGDHGPGRHASSAVPSSVMSGGPV